MNWKKLRTYGVIVGVLGLMEMGVAAQFVQINPERDPADPSLLEMGNVHSMFKRGVDMDGLIGATGINNKAAAHLNYYGGPVIQNVKVYKVLYGGTGTYQSFVSAPTSTTASMAAFFNVIGSSSYFSWLTEYNTTSPSQHIGAGSYGGSYTITPAASRNGSTITDAQIQAELSAQVTAGVLPAPTNNILFMVFFPKGKTITQGGSKSCVAGGFCAYHGTFKRNSQYVFYGVLPDMSAGTGCATGCGNGTAFGNQTSVASHELVEAVTDAAVGLATNYAPPLAWYDPNHGEIGDICNANQGSITIGAATYTVQKQWSNAKGNCIVNK